MPRETISARKTRAVQILSGLKHLYPDARTELEYGNPFELLISTILSAQATDKSVNAATPVLFKTYPTAARMARATPEDIEPLIKTIGLYRNKAKNLVATARALEANFGGEVPNDFDAIQTLPGVGRKTANVVLSNAYGRPGIAVDTHVGRLSRRLSFSAHTDPDRVEGDLEKLFPVEEWIFLHHALILHGRRVCEARKPRCEVCELLPNCPRIGV
ncbi:MAG: endonuclease III [Pleurocapsa sp. SU_196_0]|nr:endonuclease III [Pleurocapsa sp. SU_196_0]